MESLTTVVFAMNIWYRHRRSRCSNFLNGTRRALTLDGFARCQQMGMICRSLTFVTCLTLDGPSAGTIEAVVVLLVFIALAARCTCSSYTVDKKWITSPDWSRCYSGCTNREDVSRAIRNFSNPWCRRDLTSFGWVTVLNIAEPIAISKFEWA